MGRRSGSERRARARILNVRVDEEEREHITAGARLAGLPVSLWLRSLGMAESTRLQARARRADRGEERDA